MSTQERTFDVPDPLGKVIRRIDPFQRKRVLATADRAAVSECGRLKPGFGGDFHSLGTPAGLECRMRVRKMINGFAQLFFQSSLASLDFTPGFGVAYVGEIWV